MKVVVNHCFGGFGLSHEAALLYAKLKGFDIYAYTREDRTDGNYYRRVKPFEKCYCPCYLKQDVGDSPSSEALNAVEWLSSYDIERDDPALVQAVEQLGDKADGDHAKLAVVEIPDDVAWFIDEYDGMEYVAEKHRTW